MRDGQDPRRKIGQRIREARLHKGLTQQALATKIGVPYQQIQRYERGEKISLDRLATIARALGTKLAIAAALVSCGSGPTRAADRLECEFQPVQGDGQAWHYRTRVDGKEERCFYVGARMRPRELLYWQQALPIETPPLPKPRPAIDEEFEDRWDGLSER